ncbi:MAG TPA: hypothetical protein VM580_21095 [Labilithrix sp.]|jgi:hypothetical protein|nr:hypothetical protein [Labilithrix sp.]
MKTTTEMLEAAAKAVAVDLGITVEEARGLMRFVAKTCLASKGR